MEYVIGVLAVWFLGTLPATYIAAKLADEWNTDDYPIDTRDRVIGFILFWPVVILRRLIEAAAWIISLPFWMMYRMIWNTSVKREKSRG